MTIRRCWAAVSPCGLRWTTAIRGRRAEPKSFPAWRSARPASVLLGQQRVDPGLGQRRDPRQGVPGEERGDGDGRDDEPAERDDEPGVEARHAGLRGRRPPGRARRRGRAPESSGRGRPRSRAGSRAGRRRAAGPAALYGADPRGGHFTADAPHVGTDERDRAQPFEGAAGRLHGGARLDHSVAQRPQILNLEPGPDPKRDPGGDPDGEERA